MKVTYIGHAAVEIKTDKHSILVDPFITGNPVSKHKPEDFKPDAIILTHGHGDHLGDAVPISQKTGAPVIAIFELASYCQSKGAKAEGMNIGGPHSFNFGKIQFTPAFHSSSHDGHYLGMPCGVVITLHDNRKIYHAGDTALFSDMALIGKLGLDLAFLPIGSYYTMGPEEAFAAVQFLKPKIVVPVHYNTFPVIQQDAEQFKKRVESQTQTQVVILRPGESREL